MSDPRLPLTIAARAGRDYITPEDVADAFASGAEAHDIWRQVLLAIGRKRAEDPTLCAFVAHDRAPRHAPPAETV